MIDIVNDHLSGSDYKKEEDPKLFVSEKTGRGPLRDDWIANPPGGRIMCSYKLIKVHVQAEKLNNCGGTKVIRSSGYVFTARSVSKSNSIAIDVH